MANAKGRVVSWSMVLMFVGAVAVVLAARLTSSSAQSGAGDSAGADDEPVPPRPQRTRTPFEPYAADPGALTYEQLSDTPIPDMGLDEDPEAPIDDATYAISANETKASVDDVQTWAETHNGHAVAVRWTSYSAQMRARAKAKAAEYEAGLAGVGHVGVE